MFPNGRGVLVKVLKVGVDATDREINEGLYGNPPPGYDFLVMGHESFGIVEEVGPNVRHVKPGDYVTCTVRRPGGSIFDRIGHSDMTSEETYYERGINLLHGYMTEHYVDDAEFVVRVPAALKHLGVLAEPMSVAEKAIQQVYEAQRRLQVWEPKVAYVLGSGQIGLLSTLILRLRGVEVYTIARGAKPNLKAEIAEAYGAKLESKLKKIDEDGKLLQETPDFRLLLGQAPSPVKIFDENKYVYIYDSLLGVYVFDYFGALKNNILIQHWQNFKVAGKYIFGSRFDILYRYEINTFRYDEWKMPEAIYRSRAFNFSSTRLYALMPDCTGEESCIFIYTIR